MGWMAGVKDWQQSLLIRDEIKEKDEIGASEISAAFG
jgi:hypothetical protein